MCSCAMLRLRNVLHSKGNPMESSLASLQLSGWPGCDYWAHSRKVPKHKATERFSPLKKYLQDGPSSLAPLYLSPWTNQKARNSCRHLHGLKSLNNICILFLSGKNQAELGQGSTDLSKSNAFNLISFAFKSNQLIAGKVVNLHLFNCSKHPTMVAIIGGTRWATTEGHKDRCRVPDFKHKEKDTMARERGKKIMEEREK